MSQQIYKRHLVYIITEDWFFASHFLDRAKAALTAGYRVTVVTRCRETAAQLGVLGISLVNIEFSRRGLNPLREILTVLKLRTILRKLHPDVLHNIALKPVVLGSLAAQLARVRNVVNAPVGMGYVFTSDDTRARLLRPFIKQMIRYVLNRRDSRVVIENNDDLNDLINGKFAQRDSIALIRGAGVDLNKFKQTDQPEIPGEIIVIMVSRMLRDKGVEEFVQAAQLIAQTGTTARFLLVGDIDDGNPTSITRKQLNDWNRESNIRWLGPRTDIAELLATSHIACLPSYREGLPKSLTEAAASGRPIVTTDVPGCREVVVDGDNGFLVPPRNAERLAQALTNLIDDSALRKQMGTRGRQRAELEFANEIVIRQTHNVYDSFQSS